MSKKTLSAALSAVMALGLASNASAISQTTGTSAMTEVKVSKGMEKCYGISRAGKNDCAAGPLGCAGESKIDSDKHAWMQLPKGSCVRIVGGSLTDSTTKPIATKKG